MFYDKLKSNRVVNLTNCIDLSAYNSGAMPMDSHFRFMPGQIFQPFRSSQDDRIIFNWSGDHFMMQKLFTSSLPLARSTNMTHEPLGMALSKPSLRIAIRQIHPRVPIYASSLRPRDLPFACSMRLYTGDGVSRPRAVKVYGR